MICNCAHKHLSGVYSIDIDPCNGCSCPTHAPAVKGHAPLERISVGRPRPSNPEVQLKLDFPLLF